ncbi:hypothetical protein BMEI1476 [Brucella melitensis bv. 1 str. 16M]|uniref:Uncharacterized protein n=1 Tax=Brucella melitensis biotype 1 (strain ATCC 23456 / CCUG 17765 / NCTC 10094 / 16M) TaxID=224914 RepID=Q8YFP4_BRUME|nr:hypothetical protein BMEI1476 [Brucella melitensis bv. 1 str. 16M]AVM31486.1 hypothetical protein CUC12_09755 [Brucella melitensis]HAJ66835.1 hypothetical protein [Brucella melitensis]HAK19341.1 hypothetical protein [Brucella melitensis]HCZ31232.1 hypothetical protein [Brucella melitensis]
MCDCCSALVSGMQDCNQVIRCLPSCERCRPDSHPVDIPYGTGARHSYKMSQFSLGALSCFLSKAKRLFLINAPY